ncbi:hypothetical protein B0H17DRAFT_1063845 [Mycena rosella]|uniref:DUF6532 domain-containing protein n=1 Tax=Mycena rosella TaxID=1033263 RepID=A0AAD7DGD2_MYCRO|nr:hypothetical protein B0H17DRAFT_1063845 [Mycena rosella]
MQNINGGHVPRHVGLDLRNRRRSLSSDHGGNSSRTRGDRTPSPTAGDKRPRSPGDEDMRPAQAQKSSSSGGRPKAKDYDDVTQELIALAIKIYCCLLSTKHAFPDHMMELEFLRTAWKRACEQLNVAMDLTPTISKLITNRGSHFRGELKTKVKPLVELMYNFKSGQNKKTIGGNRQRGEDLKSNLTFTFKDITERKGIYRHPIFQKAVNAMWFANRRDEGPSFPEDFSPFPKEGLAIVLTAIENSIDEWATGIRTDLPFTTTDYRSVYESHIQALQKFEDQTQPHKILDNILVRLHNIGRFHSGAQPIVAGNTSVLRKADLDATIKEYVDDDLTESEGEQGDDENC